MADAPIVVLGAAGFIGRRLAERLADAGHRVVAATRAPAAFDRPGIRNVVAPFDTAAHFRPLLAEAVAVVHAASSSTPASSAAQPQVDGNLRTTLALVEALQSVPATRLVYLSSGGTLYGDRDTHAREGDPLRPRSYHGAGKAAAELFIQAWATQYAGTAVVLRPSNVYGPGQPQRQGFGIIPAALDAARRGVPIELWGGGDTLRDFLYIDDFLALCTAALEHPFAEGTHVFNASRGEGVAINALLDTVARVTGRPVPRVARPARRVDVRAIVPDNSAARRTFDWDPSTSLSNGLATTWDWFHTPR